MRYALSILTLSIMLAACSTQPTPAVPTGNEEHSAVGNAAAQQELARLASLTEKGTVSVDDFKVIETMVAADEHATDELGEIETMVKYQEYEHAGHGIGFLAGYLQDGTELLCPGHALSHYYVFTKHGEDERAEDALAEAQEMLPDWKEKAKEYSEAYPGPHSYEETAKAIDEHLAAIEAGNASASDEEVEFLSSAICVPAS